MKPATLSLLALLVATPAAAQWSQSQLSAPRSGLSATSVGDLALFAGGGVFSPLTSVVDVYDDSTGSWSTMNLSLARNELGAASWDGKAYFGGGIDALGSWNIVDVFDAATGGWSTLHMPTVFGDTVATAVDGIVLFSNGGAVDLLDVATGTWSSSTLSIPRDWMGVTTVWVVRAIRRRAGIRIVSPRSSGYLRRVNGRHGPSRR